MLTPVLRNPVLSASGTVNLETEHSRTVFSEATSSGLIDNKDSLCSTPPESSVTATRTVVPLSNIDTKCKDCEFSVCVTNTAKLCDSQLSAAVFCVPQVAHSETLHDVLFCISQDIQLDTGMFSGRTVSSRDIKLSPVDIKDSDFASSKLGWKSTGTVSVQPVDLYDCFCLPTLSSKLTLLRLFPLSLPLRFLVPKLAGQLQSNTPLHLSQFPR